MSMKQREKFLRRSKYKCYRHNKQSHSISVSKCGILYLQIEILDENFNSVSNLLQDPASIVQCLGSEGYLAKSESNPSQPHHIKLNKNGSFACNTSCIKFKSYRICRHTIAVAEKEKYLEKILWFVRSNQVKFSA